MSFLLHPAIPPVRIKRIILATGCRCELCGKEVPAADMEVHLITHPEQRTETIADLEREILVLCPRCHFEVHDADVGEEDQLALLAFRKAGVTEEIRKILASRPKRYVPPDVILDEAFSDVTRDDPHYRVM